MADSLLTSKHRKEIIKSIVNSEYKTVIKILDSVKTDHAGTAKTKDKRFVIREILNFTKEKYQDEKLRTDVFFNIGSKLCSMKGPNALEIGANIIWFGYEHNKRFVTNTLKKIADSDNWEVRESVTGPLANLLYKYSEFYCVLQKWSKHKSVNIRRAVVLASTGLDDTQKPENVDKAFKLLEPLLYDKAVYVKKNLGPFVLGGWWGRHYPDKFFWQLDKWIRIKDENVRWNIAMCFNNSTGNKYPEKAMKYLKILNKDKNKTVQRAVKSTLNFLRKRNKGLSM
jgi:hypothetical protein